MFVTFLWPQWQKHLPHTAPWRTGDCGPAQNTKVPLSGCTQSMSYWMSFSICPTSASVVADSTHTHCGGWCWAFLSNKADNPSEPGMEMCRNAASAPTLGRCLSHRDSGVARDGGSGHWHLCASVWHICALACKKINTAFPWYFLHRWVDGLSHFLPCPLPPILLSVCFSCFRVEHLITSQGDDTKRGSTTLSPSDHVLGDWMLASAIKQGRISQDLPADLWGVLLQAPCSQEGDVSEAGLFCQRWLCALFYYLCLRRCTAIISSRLSESDLLFLGRGRGRGDGVWKAMKLQLISQRRSCLSGRKIILVRKMFFSCSR